MQSLSSGLSAILPEELHFQMGTPARAGGAGGRPCLQAWPLLAPGVPRPGGREDKVLLMPSAPLKSLGQQLWGRQGDPPCACPAGADWLHAMTVSGLWALGSGGGHAHLQRAVSRPPVSAIKPAGSHSTGKLEPGFPRRGLGTKIRAGPLL